MNQTSGDIISRSIKLCFNSFLCKKFTEYKTLLRLWIMQSLFMSFKQDSMKNPQLQNTRREKHNPDRQQAKRKRFLNLHTTKRST